MVKFSWTQPLQQIVWVKSSCSACDLKSFCSASPQRWADAELQAWWFQDISIIIWRPPGAPFFLISFFWELGLQFSNAESHCVMTVLPGEVPIIKWPTELILADSLSCQVQKALKLFLTSNCFMTSPGMNHGSHTASGVKETSALYKLCRVIQIQTPELTLILVARRCQTTATAKLQIHRKWSVLHTTVISSVYSASISSFQHNFLSTTHPTLALYDPDVVVPHLVRPPSGEPCGCVRFFSSRHGQPLQYLGA